MIYCCTICDKDNSSCLIMIILSMKNFILKEHNKEHDNDNILSYFLAIRNIFLLSM